MKNGFLVFLTAFLWISCSSLSDIAATTLGGDVGATTTDTSTSTASDDSTTISSTGTDTDSTDSSSSSDSSSDSSDDSSSAGDNSATSDDIGVSDSGDITVETSDSIDSITDDIDTTIDTDSSNSPVVFVPLPEAFSSLSYLTTAADGDDEAVAQADVGSLEASATLSITNASYGQRLQDARERLAFLKPVRNFAENHLPGFVSSFLNQMVDYRRGEVTSPVWVTQPVPFIPSAFADSGACIADSDGEVIATVNADGSLDPTPIPGYHTGDVLSIAYCDPATGTLGTADTASAFTRVLYLGDTPSSSSKIASSNGDLFFLDDDGNILEMNYDATDDRFFMGTSVNGFDGGYAMADAGTPDELDLDTTNSGYVFRESGVVSAYSLDSSSHSFTDLVVDGSRCTGSSDCTSASICPSVSGCSANNVKIKSGKVYFSTEWTSAHATGEINELYDNTSNKIDFVDSSTYYENSTTGTSERGIELSAIKAFDVVEDEDAGHWSDYITVFEDGNGTLRLFGQGYSFDDVATMSTVSLTLSGITTVRDLIITNAADHAGSAALLYDHRLQLFTYDLNQVTCEEEDTDCTASTASITRTDATDFTDNENPVAMAVNEAGTMAFVLNQGSDTNSTDDDYVTVVDLATGGRHGGLGETLDPDGNGVLPLSTFLDDRVLTDFSPMAIHAFTVGDDTYLFVAADHMNLGIVVGPF